MNSSLATRDVKTQILDIAQSTMGSRGFSAVGLNEILNVMNRIDVYVRGLKGNLCEDSERTLKRGGKFHKHHSASISNDNSIFNLARIVGENTHNHAKQAKRKINWAGKNKDSLTKEKSEKEFYPVVFDTYPEDLSNYKMQLNKK